MEDIHTMFEKFRPTILLKGKITDIKISKPKESKTEKEIYPGGLYEGCRARQTDYLDGDNPLVTVVKIEKKSGGEFRVHHIHDGCKEIKKCEIKYFTLVEDKEPKKRRTKKKIFRGGLYEGCEAEQMFNLTSDESKLVIITKIEECKDGRTLVHHIHKGKTSEMKSDLDDFRLVK